MESSKKKKKENTAQILAISFDSKPRLPKGKCLQGQIIFYCLISSPEEWNTGWFLTCSLTTYTFSLSFEEFSGKLFSLQKIHEYK